MLPDMKATVNRAVEITDEPLCGLPEAGSVSPDFTHR